MTATKVSTILSLAFIVFITVFGISGCSTTMEAADPEMLELEGDLGVHDPVIICEGDTFYIFSTGRGRGGIIPIKSSKDLYNWKRNRVCV